LKLDLDSLLEIQPPAGVLSLDISANRFRRRSALSGALKTGYLYAQGNQLQDLAPLLELPELRQVFLESNWLDLTPGARGAEQVATLRAQVVRRSRPGIAVELRGRGGQGGGCVPAG
jgi:Leucine-rich repeat (LRR) protein